MSKDQWPSRRVVTVTVRLDEESYKWFVDFLERNLPYTGDFTPENHPLLAQMRNNVEYTTLIKFPNKEEPTE